MVENLVDLTLKNVQYPLAENIREITKYWCQKKQIKGEEELKIWKEKNGFNEDQWNDYITRKWRWTKWCMDKFSERIPNYYLDKKSMLDKVEYSLIRVSSENLANELYLRIKEKESTFEEIAKKYSEGPEKQTQGIIGPDPIGKAHPALAKLLQISEKGQLWIPRKIDMWWIIVRLNYIKNSSLNESLSKELALELGSKFIQELMNDKSFDKLNELLE
ncbi:peptidylprolyl isomerase [Prochlorococcus marinus]|uniref:peptidylprolyl isomerase n=1 Tax=Prochlorococcus marinus TaxID=1219 RepID=UPI001ADC10BD|nr:peptidylprolyl isomerase [Prochlorococcus marinus]MBO8218856.1 hypothetical protein [Prochlorococcus marinus CUG1416]MBW3051260.1 hypothetical protein [Prochlorococcus marinus str. MU1416]